MNKFVDGMLMGVLGFLGVAIVYTIIIAVINARDSAICLENNFRSTSTTWDLKSYCTARLEGSDIVVPIGVVKNAPSR